MNRITEITIAGKTYYLNYSTKIAKIAQERYGGMENFTGVFQDKPLTDTLAELNFLLAAFIVQGAAYKKLEDGTDAPVLTEEELEVLISPNEVAQRVSEIFAAMGTGMKATVELEPDPKNGEAA